MKLEQIWHPYWLWEDQLMYTPFSSKKDMGRIRKAIDLLSDPKAFDRRTTTRRKFGCRTSFEGLGK